MTPTVPTNLILLVTGAMAAGKSSVAQRLAEQMDRSIHLRGDVFRQMVVNGRVDMSANPDPEATRQLLLRYRAAASTAKLYSESGFRVIYQEVIIGPLLDRAVSLYDGFPLYVVVLCPSQKAIIERENARSKTGYGEVTVEQLQSALQNTPRRGLWLDTSDQSVEETATTILGNLNKARILPA